ncbi:MAG: DUF3604 domain-containing protein [Desulfuromonadales bacterium]|nr:DUF3604 domain-containing protein [Desulfuromonadales bacterium]MDH3867818.1 DUF3604 domain-containing protein [Desulfuromonadales bacterium]MDH4023813.1 DUF3604 domain-containing protein [Desulfuromonadales bacterium]
MNIIKLAAVVAFASILLPSMSFAVEYHHGSDAVEKKISVKEFSPYVGRSYPTQVYWGDQHLHTEISVDAGTMVRLGQEDAYRFARGEEVTSTTGVKAKLSRPLDWLVISDHAEMYGLMPKLLKGDPNLLKNKVAKKWYDALKSGDKKTQFATLMEIVGALNKKDPPFDTIKITKNAWKEYTALADRYNEPGRFSAIIGYEYTSRGGYNLHRNVLFRGDASVANQTLPFSQFDSQNPEDLWKALDQFEQKTGADVLAIPHNGNLSNGLMFSVETNDGKPYSKELAALRAKMEPLVEVTQIKGDGESHPFLSPNDEFADYETWDDANLDGTEIKKQEMLQYEYARSALKIGLQMEEKLGVNPFKFGMASGTDGHTALTAVEENNFFGKHPGVEPDPKRWEHVVIKSSLDDKLTTLGWQQAAGGYTGVWATENTREAIFDAMIRKETYATTGPRMRVRLFGGWEFTEEDSQSRMPARIGYDKGVPMGGDLYDAPKGKAPTFLVAAVKDPYSGNLDRIQIIKGWLDKKGETHEKVYDVAWSGDRKPGKDGKLPAVGNTVDVKKATWTNSIGAPELVTTWEDPDFDPKEKAFYYARVIEIPTPRWTAYEAKRYGVEMPENVPMITNERAYTSPIWYNPEG